MQKEKRDYTGFDKFIRAEIDKGTIRLDMNNMELNEALLNLGVRRKKHEIDGRTYVSNVYPHPNQLRHIKEVMDEEKHKQQKIDLYQTYESGFKAKEFIYFEGKLYKKGQFLPKRYIYGRKK